MKYLCVLLSLLILLPNINWAQVEDDANSVDAQFSNPTNFTDEQMNRAKDFVHQGIKDRVIQEKCKAANGCKDEGEGFPLEKIIGAAYTAMGMMSMMGGDFMSLKRPPTDEQIQAAKVKNENLPKGSEEVKPEQDDQKDYCAMAAMAYETIGGVIQQSLQKKADNSESAGDAQLQALKNLHETHKARAKTARYQSYVYGIVTTCYVTMLATGNVTANASFIIKMGGAAALTGLYISKSNKHKKAAGKVGDVIASLDWAGKKCNPWTKTKCFCSEVTSKTVYPNEYQEVCLLNKGNFETPKVALGCVNSADGKLTYDKECKCKASNSCVKNPLIPFTPQYGLGANLMTEANKTFDMLNSGLYDEGLLDRATLKQAALASNIKFKKSNKIKSPSLNEEQKIIASQLEKYMPKNFAGIVAASKPSNLSKMREPALNSVAISKISPEIKKKLGQAIKVNYAQRSRRGNSRNDGPDFVMPKFNLGKDKELEVDSDTLTFAEKATKNAEITKSPSTPIFDLITHRYRVSGWKRLETLE